MFWLIKRLDCFLATVQLYLLSQRQPTAHVHVPNNLEKRTPPLTTSTHVISNPEHWLVTWPHTISFIHCCLDDHGKNSSVQIKVQLERQGAWLHIIIIPVMLNIYIKFTYAGSLLYKSSHNKRNLNWLPLLFNLQKHLFLVCSGTLENRSYFIICRADIIFCFLTHAINLKRNF